MNIYYTIYEVQNITESVGCQLSYNEKNVEKDIASMIHN